MSHDVGKLNRDSDRNSPSAEGSHQEAPGQDRPQGTPGPVEEIKTAEDAVQSLRALSRDTRALQEGLSRLSSVEFMETKEEARHLRLGQSALGHAAAVFELLASLLERK